MKPQSFPKSERLSSKKLIEYLFKEGQSKNFFPIRLLVAPFPTEVAPTHQVLISVPARHFKRAVDRNLLKRRLREAYRLNKHQIGTSAPRLLAYIYTAREILPFKEIERAVKNSFQYLAGDSNMRA